MCARQWDNPEKDWGSRWCDLHPRSRTASDPSTRSEGRHRSGMREDHSSWRTPSETPDDRNEVPGTRLRGRVEFFRSLPAEYDRAGNQGAPPAPAETIRSRVAPEKQRADPWSWLNPKQVPRRDVDQVGRGAI